MTAVEDSDKSKPVTVQVNLSKMRRIGAKPSFPDYLVQLWGRRQFILYDARARVQSANDKDRLGSLWLIINPILLGLTFYFIFGVLLETSRGIENFLGYLVIGIFSFQVSAQAVVQGSKSLSSNSSVIRAFNFPRASLPVAVNLRQLLASIPSTIVMLLIIVLAPPVEEISWRWFLIIPAIALQHLFNLGVGMLLAPLVLKVHDVGNLLGFATRLWMYSSAIFYSLDRFAAYPTLVAVLELNPLFCVIDILRDCLLYNTTPDLQTWGVLALWAFGAIIAGFALFWRQEESYGRAS
ncbi:ABC transporter permease [Arthrobacter flavus]|uniref:Transport permease protein n=1 Tax=Arthrobacter flavus TaxID=95172 RepID=A0ABW4QBG6_9MICC